MLASVIKECEDIAGAQLQSSINLSARGMTIAQGHNWRFAIGVPRDRQQHYVQFERDEDAVFYVLKHGGVIVSDIDDIQERS
jgi:hypothetical protein